MSGWETTDRVERFLEHAGAFLHSRPAEHTVLLTVAESLRVRGADAFGAATPRFGWWQDDGGVAGAFLHTALHPLLLAAGEDAARALGRSLAGRPPPGVNAPVAAGEAFAGALGAPARVQRRERLYRLAELTPPDPAPEGRRRVAGPQDRALLIDWFDAFAREAHLPSDPGQVDDRLSYGGLHLWELAGGEPVALAGLSRQLAAMRRVGPVYTPPEHRRRGFGAAITAAASRVALDAGAADLLLFTDLSNPTSNAIYQRLGYRPVEDRVVLAFGDVA